MAGQQEHARVFARAHVLQGAADQGRRRNTRPPQQPGDHLDVFRRPRVGRRHDRDLFVGQGEGVGRAARHHRRRLERLGRGAQKDLRGRVADPSQERARLIDDGDDPPVDRLDGRPPHDGGERLEAGIERAATARPPVPLAPLRRSRRHPGQPIPRRRVRRRPSSSPASPSSGASAFQHGPGLFKVRGPHDDVLLPAAVHGQPVDHRQRFVPHERRRCPRCAAWPR